MAKKKRKIPLRKIIAKLKRKADKSLSDYVRMIATEEYGKCPLCGINKIDTCFHFVTRNRCYLRWSLDNVEGTCRNCNLLENFWPDLSRAWYIRRHGVDAYLKLVEDSKQSFTPTAEYLENVIATYTILRIFKPR